MSAYTTINPSTGESLHTYMYMSDSEVEQRVSTARPAFLSWAELSFAERAKFMLTLAGKFREFKEDLARQMAIEMGKPLLQGIAEAEKCASCCEYFARHAEEFLRYQEYVLDAPTSATNKNYVVFQPLGGIFAIMPWNFPFWQVIRCFVPAAMAGNVVFLKHAPNTFGCALLLEHLIRESGFPDGVFTNLIIDTHQAERVIKHPFIQTISLTGSGRAGASVAALAGASLKKTVLELGGSDPYIILDDADLHRASETCVASRLINTGQSCIAAKRFIVVESVRKRFEELFVQKIASKTVGDPLDGTFDLGPLARKDLRDNLDRQVYDSIKQGATPLLTTQRVFQRGYFFNPVVLTNVRAGMPVYHEETFGPVAAILPAKDQEDAIRIANDTIFGLGAAVFTKNRVLGEHIARERIQTGFCAVNDFVRSDPRLPFGGIKDSGYGRELSPFGIREFVNIKTIYIR